MFGKELSVEVTSSGHYTIPINKTRRIIEKIEKEEGDKKTLFCIKDLESKTVDEKKKIGEKIHKQFGHAAGTRLKRLIKLAGIEDQELSDMVEKASSECETCVRFRKQKLKPAVGFSLAEVFNRAIAMDLKHINNFQILHLIDLATRFSATAIVGSKRKEEIMDKIMKHWIAIFGAPKEILSDNGREFDNELMRDLGEQFNINIRTTAAESPWSNRTVERHNAVLGDMVVKILDDMKCSKEVALAWALSAKNSLQNNFGYSPNQLFFGHNPNVPMLLNNKLPALEQQESTSEMLLRHQKSFYRV